jgi:hypothetical protein
LSEPSDLSQETSIPEIVDNDCPAVGEIDPTSLGNDLRGGLEIGEWDDPLVLAGLQGTGFEKAKQT